MIMLEFDLAGAEWVVVAYLADDENMINVVKSGKSPHVVTGALISGASEEFVLEEHKLVGSHTDANTIEVLRSKLSIPPGIFLPRVMSIRQAGKKSNHGLNYNMKYRRFALENEMIESDAEPIVKAYIDRAYPGLKEKYWPSIRAELSDNKRVLKNCFGRQIRLLNEWGEELFNQAYSFKPQSTVVDVCNFALKSTYLNTSSNFERVEIGAQTHDSFQIQIPTPRTRGEWIAAALIAQAIMGDYMKRPISYNGHTFSLNCDGKLGLNWGDMFSFKFNEDVDILAQAMQNCYDDACRKSAASLEEFVEAEVAAAESLPDQPQSSTTDPCPPEELSQDYGMQASHPCDQSPSRPLGDQSRGSQGKSPTEAETELDSPAPSCREKLLRQEPLLGGS